MSNDSTTKRVPYVTVWDGGIEVVTACTIDLCTGKISDIEVAKLSDCALNALEHLEREYIVLDGDEYEVDTEDGDDGNEIRHADLSKGEIKMPNKMLVVVDYQNDFVNGALGFPHAESLDDGIAAKVMAAAQNGDTIVYTMDTHGEDYLETREGKALPIPHCIQGTVGWQLYGKTEMAMYKAIRSKAKVICLRKNSFGSSPIEMTELLSASVPAPESIEVVGLVTNMCVVANVCCFQAMYPQAQVIVDASLCASFDTELHNKTLDVLRGMQVEVRER